ncbi:uncharacterized protein F5147DRAFT_780837 [Suillus discolor]|uniref:Fanconi-associated nuclease n=1 Tax=Suillus discolor TaxID=1912936 RepID=A0A9P7ET68_9AGAM|nr:uncharacterized protein F5147DRAFT_780837 [Suillus discolor]KAG2088829.1 hypothetical protein F5147DRAFT_780837 [Suillus discolor]
MFAGNFAAVGAEREFKTPAADELRFKTPVTPSAAPGAPQTSISTKTVQTSVSNTFATPASSSKGRPQSRSGVSGNTEKSDSVRVRGARLVKEIFEEVYPHWQALVKMKNEGGLEGKERGYGLERFESGHVLTRLVCKGAHALGILGEHEYELNVLESLLAQRWWRRGRRGRWYERWALILEKHVVRYDDALLACLDALKDDDTHIVFRPKLDRRLTALEKKLKVEPADRHTSEWNLQPLVLVSLEGVRVRHRAASLKLDRSGRNINDSAKSKVSITQAGDITKFLSPKKPGVTKVDATPVSIKAEVSERKEEKGKFIWTKGSKESSLPILFWDIIFLPIPGAFETPFQTAPLDIAEEAFYHARRDPIETRLKELEDGQGEEIVNRVEAEHRARKMWCIGVDWELVEEGEIVKIVRRLGGTALSVICHIVCEDYAGRCSGGPDLFMWNADTGKCKFVEVKGPGNSLQENQKLWIDVLLRAGTAVELCSVHQQGKGDENKTGKKGKPKGSTKKRRGKAKDMVESDDEEDEVQRMYESEDDADALPVAPIPIYMDDEFLWARSDKEYYVSLSSALRSSVSTSRENIFDDASGIPVRLNTRAASSQKSRLLDIHAHPAESISTRLALMRTDKTRETRVAFGSSTRSEITRTSSNLTVGTRTKGSSLKRAPSTISISSSKTRESARSKTPANEDEDARTEILSPDLPIDPVTPVTDMKRQSTKIVVEAQKPKVRTNAGRTRTETGSTGLNAIGTAKSRGSKDKGKGNEVHVDAEDAGKYEELNAVEEDEEEAQVTHERELSMQVSPRRPVEQTWVPSPLRQNSGTFPMQSGASGAYELFRGLIADMQTKNHADVKALHVDMLRMGRGLRQEM